MRSPHTAQLARYRRIRSRVELCVCGKPRVLHFDARGRKLDCARVTDKRTALADARTRLAQLARYIVRIEREA